MMHTHASANGLLKRETKWSALHASCSPRVMDYQTTADAGGLIAIHVYAMFWMQKVQAQYSVYLSGTCGS